MKDLISESSRVLGSVQESAKGSFDALRSGVLTKVKNVEWITGHKNGKMDIYVGQATSSTGNQYWGVFVFDGMRLHASSDPLQSKDDAVARAKKAALVETFWDPWFLEHRTVTKNVDLP